eukprot:m.59670 g.59670  ORF g.59670 m.59670 type:complete len:296 (+) comp15710_c0_seq1:232-1119(+)
MSTNGSTNIIDPNHGFKDLVELTTSEEEKLGFKQKYDKNGIKVWTRVMKGDPLRMIKVTSTIACAPTTVRDTLLDTEYRYKWDDLCKACCTLYRVNDHCTVDYFKMKCPTPLANRDMVLQVSWKQEGDTIWVWQSSFAIKSKPPEKKTVRSYTRLAGYRFQPTADGKYCDYTFISHSNPGGKIPKFLVNYTTSTFAPGFIKTFSKACVEYPQWKAAQTNPEFMPWLNPDQHGFPFYDPVEHGVGTDVNHEILTASSPDAQAVLDDYGGVEGADAEEFADDDSTSVDSGDNSEINR